MHHASPEIIFMVVNILCHFRIHYFGLTDIAIVLTQLKGRTHFSHKY